MNLRLANKIVNAVANESDKERYSEGKVAAALRRVERTVESKRAEAYWWHAISLLRQAKKEEGGRGGELPLDAGGLGGD